MRKLERILKALANQRRLALLAYLKAHHEANVTELAEAIRLSVKATSKHLRILAAADLVDRRQVSLVALYSLSLNRRTILTDLQTIL